jgi:hypothetical protein
MIPLYTHNQIGDLIGKITIGTELIVHKIKKGRNNDPVYYASVSIRYGSENYGEYDQGWISLDYPLNLELIAFLDRSGYYNSMY